MSIRKVAQVPRMWTALKFSKDLYLTVGFLVLWTFVQRWVIEGSLLSDPFLFFAFLSAPFFRSFTDATLWLTLYKQGDGVCSGGGITGAHFSYPTDSSVQSMGAKFIQKALRAWLGYN